MANTVITNYTDLNGPSSKSDSSVVVIVNKDGSLSVDQKLLGTLMGSDGSQAAGISVVRVGHEGKPDDATDSENEDEKIPHITLSVDSYCDEPNSIIKYDSGAEMLQSLRIETRENSLVGFHNDHCYTSLKSPSQVSQQNEAFSAYDDPVIEIRQTPPQRSVQHNKKITILEQQIIPKGKKIIINPTEASVILKGNDILNKPLPVLSKTKHREVEKKIELEKNLEESADSSSISSSSESAPDRDSDSDYKDAKDRSMSLKLKRSKVKPRILKNSYLMKESRLDTKTTPKSKLNRSIVKRDIREKIQKNMELDKRDTIIPNKDSLSMEIPVTSTPSSDQIKIGSKQVQKAHKKEKKTPAHVTALLSDMTSLFSTPDVIRRVSTDNKTLLKQEKETVSTNKKANTIVKSGETNETKSIDNSKFIENTEKLKGSVHKTYIKQNNKSHISSDKPVKSFDTMPQLDDASLAQILQEPTPTPMKIQPSVSTNANVINSPGLAGPLSPTLDLLAGLQPEEEGLTEDLLMHVAQLVESSENLQEVIDKQVLGKVDTLSKAQVPIPSLLQQPQILNNTLQTPSKLIKNLLPRKDPIEIVRRDGRVITLPPIEAPATRASKRKSQVESSNSVTGTPVLATAPLSPIISAHEPALQPVSKQYVNKKLTAKKQDPLPIQTPIIEKTSAESQESWNSEDDPNRLWCICKQPHNNRFMICCDSCEDWFHGKCVNITKAMGQQMEEEGIEWRCPNCVKSTKTQNKILNKVASATKNIENQNIKTLASPVLAKDQGSKTNCIVCKKSACASSIYCSDACILRHAQDSLGSQGILKPDEKGNVSEKLKSESRVIVYERKTGRLLAGPNAPTAENLKSWLQKNPTFEVVRPGTLSTIKPNLSRKKSLTEANKIQTMLNFEKVPKKSQELKQRLSMPEYKDKAAKPLLSPKEEIKTVAQPKTPVTPKSQQSQQALDTAKSHTTSSAGKTSESRKAARTPSRSHSTVEKAQAQAPSVLPLTPRRKDASESRMKLNSAEPIRDNVKKALHEQMSSRMAETSGVKFTEDEILQFAIETEFELHELFRDVGMKYKAKYRSLMFNIKDRKNLSLWQKICDRRITPQQLVRLSPEELASQELAQWRSKEAKHQLELIKKSELDLLAASKTYVLKTHKGEEVMETKESVSTELDPNVPVEDLVTALNDSMGKEQPPEVSKHMLKKTDSGSHKKYGNSKKKDKENGLSGYKSKRESKKDSESKKSRSSRKRSENRDRELRTRRSDKKLRRSRSQYKEDSAREKTDSIENVKDRSRSRVKSKRHKENSRSTSRGRERSRSSGRSRHRSRSKEYPKHRQRSRSKHDYSTEEKVKHRSKSQENPYSKNKNDSTDSESIERPKSAMLKETHPEYDPHEPMITSAFSEEDLRKSREDVYEDGYKNDLSEYSEVDYDPSKSFSIGTSVATPMESYITTQDKASEVESDQEPSSTVENSAPIVWNGCINMVDVARFYVAAHEVSGNSVDIEDDLSAELDVVGRINPETVWDYILKMKRAGNKDIVILRLQAANDEEKMQYIALYSYLSSRNRLGVVKVSNTATVKDFYIVPLSANSSLPPVLLPLEGPRLEVKTHLLIAIVIRQRKKRLPTNIPKEIIPTKVIRESSKRSYTPPVGNKSSYTPPASPKRRAALPLPVAYASPVLSTTIKDKIAATLASAEDEEAYSPGSSTSNSSAPASSTLRCKMAELNRQIEEQKQQILKMTQADSSIGAEDEAYSPSRPMTPPSVVPLADIALPSNLQEILATIKQRTETAADVDMRTLPPL